MRSTPAAAAASSTLTEPATFVRYIALGVRDPQTVVRRDMEHRSAAAQGRTQRVGLGDVAHHHLDRKTREVAPVAAGAYEPPHRPILREQRAHDGCAEEAVRARDQRRRHADVVALMRGRHAARGDRTP